MDSRFKTSTLKYIVGIVMVCVGCSVAVVSTIMSYLMLKND